MTASFALNKVIVNAEKVIVNAEKIMIDVVTITAVSVIANLDSLQVNNFLCSAIALNLHYTN
jgi:hypothetical protein